MRLPVLAVAWVACLTGGAMAQHADDNWTPREIANQANGFSYQPTPGEVYPREAAAGLLPSKESRASTDRTLEDLDQTLLRGEGLSTQGVPAFTPRQ